MFQLRHVGLDPLQTFGDFVGHFVFCKALRLSGESRRRATLNSIQWRRGSGQLLKPFVATVNLAAGWRWR
jgi:hypothetical protein